MQAKTPKDTRATLTEIVLPNDTNNLIAVIPPMLT